MTDLTTLAKQLSKATNPSLRRALKQRIEVAALKSSIDKCRNCPLGESATFSVPLDGPTHGRADLIVVGEAPGFNEDKAGRPFVGRAGAVLDRCIELAGSDRSRMVVLNTLAHRPPNNRDPEAYELAACKHWFDRQLDTAGLWIGVALGGYALANIMGVPRSSIAMKDYLEQPIWVDGRIWFGTYHPAYALRNPLAKREIVLSMRAALSLRYSEDRLLPRLDNGVPDNQRREESAKVMKGLDVLGSEKVGAHLSKWGWSFGHSEILGEKIIVLLGGEEPIKKPIPQAMKDYPRWELSELLKIGEAGRSRGGWGKDEMRRLAMIRHEFNGRVVA